MDLNDEEGVIIADNDPKTDHGGGIRHPSGLFLAESYRKSCMLTLFIIMVKLENTQCQLVPPRCTVYTLVQLASMTSPLLNQLFGQVIWHSTRPKSLAGNPIEFVEFSRSNNSRCLVSGDCDPLDLGYAANDRCDPGRNIAGTVG